MADKKPRKQAGRKRKRRRLSEKRPKEQQRTKTVGVRLSEAEFAELAAQAKSQHATKAAILRANWLGKPLTKVPLPEVLGPAAWPARVLKVDELISYHELVAMGSRLKRMEEDLKAEVSQRAEARFVFGKLRFLLAELVPPRSERK